MSQSSNHLRLVSQIISDWFLEHDNEFTLLKCPPQSPDLNPIEHLWDVVEREILIMDVQTTNLQQLCDAIMTIWTKISEQCFQHLVESMPRRIKTALKTKGGVCVYVYLYIYIPLTVMQSILIALKYAQIINQSSIYLFKLFYLI